MENYLFIKSKELRKRLIKTDRDAEKEMKIWWEKILPRKGSLLRQLVNKELSNNQSITI